MTSYADEKFWAQYKEFVQQSLPRHDNAVRFLCKNRINPYNQKILDLGCGRTCEALSLLAPSDYLGIDLDPPEGRLYAEGDYRLDGFVSAFGWVQPTGFSSLFSTEVTGPAEANERLYHDLFEIKSLKWGIVSGFYYKGKADKDIVEEAGGLKSYQSVAPKIRSNVFEERRTYVDAPSDLFGPDVVEVWKLFIRK